MMDEQNIETLEFEEIGSGLDTPPEEVTEGDRTSGGNNTNHTHQVPAHTHQVPAHTHNRSLLSVTGVTFI